jgi:tetratricopeptide (TPR) repeat protein
VCSSAAALPCLWDRDTLRFEAQGLPGIVETITGRFEREPDRLYEVRLERVAREIAAEPERLDLYDDAGVACDRLHRGDEAVAWMERKFAVLEGLADSPSKDEALYRYHANLGTFLAHRWLRGGADRGDLRDLQAGREHIRRALELNPDAHFGRERYQEYALTWLITLPTPAESGPSPDEVPWTLLDACPPEQRPTFRWDQQVTSTFFDPNAAAATTALAGLIVLGDAWPSVDVFNTLARSLELQGHASVAYLAGLRARELALAGRRSLHPEFAAADPDLALRLASFEHIVDADSLRTVERFFDAARAESDGWHAQRTAFVLRRLDEGRHPDTDTDFWSGYSSPPPPTPPGALISGEQQLNRKVVGAFVLLGVVAAIGSVLLFRVARRLFPRKAD